MAAASSAACTAITASTEVTGVDRFERAQLRPHPRCHALLVEMPADASFRPAACAVYTQAMACERDDLLLISLEPSDVIDAYKGGIDRTLLRENLRLTPAERVTKMLSALRFAEAVRHSGRKASQR